MNKSIFVDPKYDFPEGTPAAIDYVVCSVPRSGSNFLGTLLHGSGQAGFPAEYFLPRIMAQFAERAGRRDFRGVTDFVRRHRTSPNGVFGFKAHYDQFLALGREVDIDTEFPGLKYLHISRRDALAQAISFARALQTDRFTSAARAEGHERFDPELIEDCLNKLFALEASWRRFFAHRGVPVLEIVYEDLAADPARTLLEIGRFLGLPNPLESTRKEHVVERQSDGVNEEWRERMLALNRARRFPQPDEQIFWMHGAPLRMIAREGVARINARLGGFFRSRPAA